MLLYKINETITPCSAEEVFSAGAPKQGQYVAVLGPDEWAEKKELFGIGLESYTVAASSSRTARLSGKRTAALHSHWWKRA